LIARKDRRRPRKRLWASAQDVCIRRLRAEGATWETIAEDLGLTRWIVIARDRRRRDRLPPPTFVAVRDDPGCAPLPAGHVRTWGAMNAGTALAHEPYPLPMFRR
jgi:hypothetical protein